MSEACSTTKHEMICTCGENGYDEAEALRIEVCERLGVKPSDLATALCLSLAWDMGQEVSVAGDMWFGVDAGLWIECDHVIDGLAYAWKWHADRLGRYTAVLYSYKGLRDLSAEQIATAARLHKERADHRAACEGCNFGDPGTGKPGSKYMSCPESERMLDEWGEAARAITGKWGEPDGDTSAAAYWGRA